MHMPRSYSLLFLGFLLAAARPSAQTPDTGAPRLQILAPEEHAYVSGLTVLRAAIDPQSAAREVAFFADGRQLCLLTAEPFTCEWEAGSAIVEHQIRVVATLADGGRVVKTVWTDDLRNAEQVTVEVVQVTVTVTDQRGRFVRGLPQSAFRVFEDGQPQPVTHFSSEHVPLELIAAIDISGSMADAMPALKQAVKTFLAAVPAGERVTLLGFNDALFSVTRRTTSPAERARAVDRLAAWGPTSLYDVIIEAVDMLGSQPGRKALVVFTDGEDQGSFAALEDVERRLQSSDVTLYLIGQGTGLSSEPLKAIMRRLATPTGGRAIFTASVEQLQPAFDDLVGELANQYLLGYARPDGRQDETWRRISVEVDGHPRVRAREGYRPRAR